jgi:hypothetical protein
MDILAGLKLVLQLLFGTIFGIPSFVLGFAMSILGGLWVRGIWRPLYWLFVLVGSLPFVTIAILPVLGTAIGPTMSGGGVSMWMLISFVACPFSVGVLVGAILAPLYR